MKVTLFALNSSYVHTNLAVRCIAKNLSRHGYAVSVLERSLKERTRDILQALVSENADVYGFSVYIWNRREMLALASDLHAVRPNAKIVFGGPEISFENESFFAANPFVDNIIAGEGEGAFVSFCDAFPERHTIIMGLPYEGFTDGGILYDEYPPDSHSGGILYYESSRGCPYSCAYCLSSATHGVRAKDAETTIAELSRFEEIDGVRVIKFVDRTFNFDRRRADRIWRAIAGEQFTKTYHFEICADLLDEENFKTLEAMPKGRIQLECGVQSTHPETLAAIGRTSDSEKIIKALTRIRSFGNIHLHADLIAGLPHENFARFAESFDALYPACDLLQLGFLKLLPGTKLRACCADMGYRYSQNAPYEVLCSDALSYEELYHLHVIDDVLDRFHGSGHFDTVISYLLKGQDSPFSFYKGLAEKTPHPRSLSQREAFLAFREYAHSVAQDKTLVDTYLMLDWYLWENASLPYPIPDARHPEENALRRDWCARHKDTPLSAVVVCSLNMENGTAVIIDRKHHTYEVL